MVSSFAGAAPRLQPHAGAGIVLAPTTGLSYMLLVVRVVRSLLVLALMSMPALAVAEGNLPPESEDGQEQGPTVAGEETATSDTQGVLKSSQPTTSSQQPDNQGLSGVDERLTEALDALSALSALLAVDSVDRDAALEQLTSTRHLLEQALVQLGRAQYSEELRLWLLEQLGAADSAQVPPVHGAATEEGSSRVSAEQFKRLLGRIDRVSFTEAKMKLLQDELGSSQVTAEQAGDLVERFNFSRDRVEALVFLHGRIVDPENFDGLLSALKFESDRQSVRTQLGLDS